jgi:hypothetical protein
MIQFVKPRTDCRAGEMAGLMVLGALAACIVAATAYDVARWMTIL